MKTRIPFSTAIEVPKRISNMLAQMSEIYLIVARRNMSEAAIEINPMSLIAVIHLRQVMSSSQILPTFFCHPFGVNVDSLHMHDRDREEQGSKIMDRLECYYAMYVCNRNSFNEPSGSEVIINLPIELHDPNNHTSEPNKLSFPFVFLRSIPMSMRLWISHEQMEAWLTAASANLSSLARSELRIEREDNWTR